MSKVNASIFYMLGSFIFLLSVIIPQFANAQEDIPKINEKQKEALELFSNSQSKHQQTSAVDIQQNNINSDKNILKKIIQQELQEKSLKEQGQEQQQQQQQQVKQGIQQQQTESDNNQIKTSPEVIIYEHANFGGEQQSIKESVPNVWSWNDKISSVIVKSGTWQFFEHENYGSPSSKQVGPGNYDYVEIPEFNIRNDNITAIKVISSSPQGDHLNSKSLKEQSQEQVTNNDKEIKALELFFNKGSQQQEIQQHSNEGKQQQQAKAKTATTDNSKPAKEQGQEIQQQQQQQVKQVIQQKADKDHQQTEPFVLFFNKLDQEQQQQYVKQQQQQREQGKQELQEKLNEQKKQQQTISQQQIEQEVQQKLEQEKQKLQEKLNEQKKQVQTNGDNEQVTLKSLKPIKEQSEKPITKEKVMPFLHNHVKKN